MKINKTNIIIGVLVLIAIILLVGNKYWGWFSSNPSPEPQPPITKPVDKGCVVGGCSGEVCTDASEPPAVSICIYRAEYACYKNAKCERQTNGSCGWTSTPALKACLASPPLQ